MAIQVNGIVYEVIAPVEAYVKALEQKAADLETRLAGVMAQLAAKVEAEAKTVVADVKKEAVVAEADVKKDKNELIDWVHAEVKELGADAEKVGLFVERLFGKKV
jgi:hypothetical protein